jgi:hypothetical protein
MKPVIVHVYTYQKNLLDQVAPEAAKKFIPKFWKDLPNALKDPFNVDSNMKYCAGFNDLYSKGIVIPAWTDFAIQVGKIGDTENPYMLANPTGNMEHVVHPQSQRGSFAPEEEWQHIKLSSPWVFKCDEPIEFLMTDVGWNKDNPSDSFVPNGVINFKWQRSTNINMLLKREKEERVIVRDYGTPLAHLIPLTERPVEFKYHLVTVEEWNVVHAEVTPQTMWHAGYYKLKKLCPFSK